MKQRNFFILTLVVFILIILTFLLFYNQGKVSPGPSTNIDSVKVSCKIACSDQNTHDYCEVLRVVNDGTNFKFEDTCYNLSANERYLNRNYGIDSCSEIDCEKK
jgi:hypothetical protein